MLEPVPGASADHIAVDRLSDNPPVAELLERISEITRRDTLDGGAEGPAQEGTMPGGEPTDRVSQMLGGEPMDGVSQGLFSNHGSRGCHSRERPWKHHWLDHSRFNSGDIRVYKRLLWLRVPALQQNRL